MFVDEQPNADKDGGIITPGISVSKENGGSEISSNDPNSRSGDERLPEKESEESINLGSETKLSPEKMNEVISNYVKDAVDQEIVAYNGLELKKKYPKAYELMIAYMNKTAHVSALDLETIIGVLLYSPRNVIFNFFDKQKIFVNIFGSDEYWRYTMEANESSEESYKNRTLCEIAGYEEAFRRLEQTLNSKTKT